MLVAQSRHLVGGTDAAPHPRIDSQVSEMLHGLGDGPGKLQFLAKTLLIPAREHCHGEQGGSLAKSSGSCTGLGCQLGLP
jgi:hypothetical protein